MVDAVREDDESGDDDEQGEEAAFDGTLQRTGVQEEADEETKDKTGLQPVDVDAHWIQRAMAKIYEPIAAQEKAREVMQILQVSSVASRSEHLLFFSDFKRRKGL